MVDTFAKFEILPKIGFKYENEIIYWNESRETVRQKLNLKFGLGENPCTDEYDEIIVQYSDNPGAYGFLFYLDYDVNEKLKTLRSPFGFILTFENIEFHCCESLKSVNDKMDLLGIKRSNFKKHNIVYEELNILLQRNENESLFEAIHLYRNIEDITSW
jgi:hypothetical protein